MKYNANELCYALIDMDGTLCLFTNMRIDRSTIPNDLHCYDVRDGDDCTGIFAEVQPFVMVNHWGTIITKEPIVMNEYGCYWPQNNDPYFGPSMDIEEFSSATQEELKETFGAYRALCTELADRINEEVKASESRTDVPLSLRIRDAHIRVVADLQPQQGKDTPDKAHDEPDR